MDLGVQYTFRHPPQFGVPGDRVYRELLEQAQWVDSQPAFRSAAFSEHHFAPDGYLPSVLTGAAAVAAVTRRLDLVTNILQLPIHHPVRVAEDALVVDAISGGRLKLGLGLGYREEEFNVFGTSNRERRARMEEGVAVLRGAFAGKPFSFAGEQWWFPETLVTPLPVRPGGPPILMGGTAPAALDRAARLADGFLAAKPSQIGGYLEACERHGTPADRRRVILTSFVVIHEDPERAIAELGEPMLVIINEYIGYGAFGDRPPAADARQVVEDGLVQILDAEGAIDLLRGAADAGVAEFHVFSSLPGEPTESGTRRLRYVAEKVYPAVAEL